MLLAMPLEASAAPTTKEARLLQLVNATRTSRGLQPLSVRDDLVRVAHRHSAQMARQGLLFHTPCLTCRVSAGSVLAENVGMAGTLQRVHRLMMRSAGHRNNLLGGFNAIGVGVVVRGGRYWVTEIFVT
jgi:uncharacterized protein YkwD